MVRFLVYICTNLGAQFPAMTNYILVPLDHPIARAFLSTGVTTSAVRGRTTNTRKLGARGGSLGSTTQTGGIVTAAPRRKRRRARRVQNTQNVQG